MPRFPAALAACLLLSPAAATLAQPVAEPPAAPEWLPDTLEFHGDLPYAGTDNARQMLDLVLPKEKSDKPLPVVAFIHGGAWLAGDKQDGLRQILPLAVTGNYAVASIGYRLTDQAQWPQQIYDCKAGIRWLRANAEKYNLDPDNIGVCGASAGGHLVAVLGTSGGVESMEGDLGEHTDVSSRVKCVVDFFGPTDFLKMNQAAIAGAGLDHDNPEAPEALLIGGPVQKNKEKAATANPITYVSKDDPPFLIVHGTKDPLVPFNQSELLRDALRDASVPCTLLTVEGGGHGWGFPREVHRTVRRYFDDQLRGKQAEWEDKTLQAAEQ